MLVPAFFYLLFNHHSPQASGWGIPMATDIAFALGILSLAGDRVPLGVKIFLTALAVVDDLGAIVVIALFYTPTVVSSYLLKALAIMLLLGLMNRLKIKIVFLYLLAGVFLWYFVLQSGIHATIAGVLLALTIPTNANHDESMLHRLELDLHQPVNYLIMPLFALCNTCIPISAEIWNEIPSKLIYGINWGLIVGKPVGILLFSLLIVKLKIAKLPGGANWKMMAGAGMLAGIGFTMSIFISMLSFDDLPRIEGAKIAVLIASTTAGIIGLLWFKLFVKANPK
jgi:NhaA family Na+:H+ antiporter